MRIERVRIENFRRFRRVEVELPDGVVALVGANGSGKSTFLEAIGWCLYGNDAARTGKDLLKRRGAAPGDDVRVQVAFRLGGNSVEVTRELAGKSETHGAVVTVDGKVVVAGGAQSARESAAYVARLLHMDAVAFFTSIVARQRELAALTDVTPAKRREILVGLLRLDAIDDAIAAGREERRDEKARLDALRALVAPVEPIRRDLAAIVAQLAKDEETIGGLDASIGRQTGEVEELRARRDAGRKLAEEARVLELALRGFEETIARVEGERARRTQELAEARAAAEEAAKLAPALEALPATRARVDALLAREVQARELARLKTELARAEYEASHGAREAEEARLSLAAAQTLPKLAERVLTERAKKEKEVLDLQRRISDLEASRREGARRLNEAAEKERRIRAMGPESPCPTCTRPLHEHYEGLVHGFAGEVEAMRAQIATSDEPLRAAREAEAAARTAVADLVARDAELREKIRRFAGDEQRALAATARHSDATLRAARLREQTAALGATPFDPRELDEARAALRALDARRDRHARLAAQAGAAVSIEQVLAELAATADGAVRERDEARGRRAILGFDAAAHAELERAVAAAETRVTETRIARERAVGERARRIDERERLAEALRRNEELAAQARVREARVRLLEELVGTGPGLLPAFKDHLVARIRPVLSLHAGRLFRELTDGRYADLELDEDYGLRIHDEGVAFPLERFSGGEGDLANLCLRLAVSQVVAERAGGDGFGFLALDEIFGSQDEARKSNILRALASLSGRFRQILLVTHIADVKERAESVLRVETMEDGTSRIVADA